MVPEEGCVLEKWTETVEQVLRRSEEEARAWRFEYIGTEHVLLALMKESSAVVEVLAALNVSLEAVRAEIKRVIEIVRRCETVEERKPIPASEIVRRSRRVELALECAVQEGEAMKLPRADVLQLLVGLAATQHGVAAECLNALGVTVEKLHAVMAAQK